MSFSYQNAMSNLSSFTFSGRVWQSVSEIFAEYVTPWFEIDVFTLFKYFVSDFSKSVTVHEAGTHHATSMRFLGDLLIPLVVCNLNRAVITILLYYQFNNLHEIVQK